MSKKKHKRDKSLELSIPETKELHGVKIVKLPVARYILALNTLENLPKIIVSELIGEAGSAKVLLEKLSNGDTSFIEAVLVRLVKTVPKELCRLLSELLGIPQERLLDVDCDVPLTLNELIEVVIAFIELNDLSDFFGNVRKLTSMLTAQTKAPVNTGSSVGLQLPEA